MCRIRHDTCNEEPAHYLNMYDSFFFQLVSDPTANGALPKFKTIKKILQSNKAEDEMDSQEETNGHQIASLSPNGNSNHGDLSCVVVGEYIARVVETTQGFSGRSLRSVSCVGGGGVNSFSSFFPPVRDSNSLTCQGIGGNDILKRDLFGETYADGYP